MQDPLVIARTKKIDRVFDRIKAVTLTIVVALLIVLTYRHLENWPPTEPIVRNVFSAALVSFLLALCVFYKYGGRGNRRR